MQVFNSQPANGGVGKMPRAQGSQLEKQKEKLSDSNYSSPKQVFDPNMKGVKVIMGSGGDHAIISMEKNPAAAAQADMGQKELIESINLPPVSEGVKTAAADLAAGAENLRQRSEALDAELTLHMQDLAQTLNRHGEDLAQALKPSNNSASAGKDKEPGDSPETLMEKLAAAEEEELPLEEQLQQSEMEEMAGPPDFKDGKQGEPTADNEERTGEYL